MSSQNITLTNIDAVCPTSCPEKQRDIMLSSFIVVDRLSFGDDFIVVNGSINKTLDDKVESVEIKILATIGEVVVASGNFILNYKGVNTSGQIDNSWCSFSCPLSIATALHRYLDKIEIISHSQRMLTQIASVANTSFEFIGDMSVTEKEIVVGWAFAPAPRSASDIFIIINDTFKVPIALNTTCQEMNLFTIKEDKKIGFAVHLENLLSVAAGTRISEERIARTNITLKLEYAGRQLAQAVYTQNVTNEGRVEKYENNQIIGWSVDVPQQLTPAQVSLYIDNTYYTTVKASKYRADLKRLNKSERWGGFVFENIRDLPTGNSTPIIDVYSSNSSERLRSSIKEIDNNTEKFREPSPGKTLNIRNYTSLSIIIPIYNAPNELDLCIKSLCQFTTVPCRLILIDDSSTDRRVGHVLERWSAYSNIEIHRNHSNLGFTKTINKGIDLAGQDDVVLLNSDTVVGPRWLEQLSHAAHCQNHVGTVTPLSNNAGAFSTPLENVNNHIPEGYSLADISRLICRTSSRSLPSAPTGNGFCLYVRRELLNSVGLLDDERFPRGYGEENDLCMRGLRAGYKNIIDDRTYIYHKRSASFGEEKGALYEVGRSEILETYPEYPYLVRKFFSSKDMIDIRYIGRKHISNLNKSYTVIKPRILYLIATMTGGTPQTNQDLMTAVSDCYETWVLRCDTRCIYLYKYEDGQYLLKREHLLRNSLIPAAHRSDEYDAVVSSYIYEYGFELLHIRHIGWHGLGVINVCKNLKVPIIFSFHDFYTVCPTVKLLDEKQNFCGGKCTAGEGPCVAELWQANEMPPLKHKFVHNWKRMMSSTLQLCDAFVTTSISAKNLLITNYPWLIERNFKVIGHGRDFNSMQQFGVRPSKDEPLRVLVPGNISAAKGADLYRRIDELLPPDLVELHILGDPGRLTSSHNIKVHGKYRREDFARLVNAIRPHIGAIMSIWPETYCHTLTEMWMCGVPVVSFDIGATGERISTHKGGWLLDPHCKPETIINFLLNKKHDLNDYMSKLNMVYSWQKSYGKWYNTHLMALEYLHLYSDVINSRRVFGSKAGCKSEYNFKSLSVVGNRSAPEPKINARKNGQNQYGIIVNEDFPFWQSDILANVRIEVSFDCLGAVSKQLLTQRTLSNINGWILDLTQLTKSVTLIDSTLQQFAETIPGCRIHAMKFSSQSIISGYDSWVAAFMSDRKKANSTKVIANITDGYMSDAENVTVDNLDSPAKLSIIIDFELKTTSDLHRVISCISGYKVILSEIFFVYRGLQPIKDDFLQLLAKIFGCEIGIVDILEYDCALSVCRDLLNHISGKYIWIIDDLLELPNKKVESSIDILKASFVDLVVIDVDLQELAHSDVQAACHLSPSDYVSQKSNADLVFLNASVYFEYIDVVDGLVKPCTIIMRSDVMKSSLKAMPPKSDESLGALMTRILHCCRENFQLVASVE